ncbi:MAG: glycosyltransferase, partial [bacterium]
VRLLLVGALPYPFAQGSQVYLQEQAIALQAAGAEVDLLTYAVHPDSLARGSARPRRLDSLRHLESPRWSAPRRLRSGPSLAKPLADIGLALALRDAVGARVGVGVGVGVGVEGKGESAPGLESGVTHYDAILTHNAEACVIALANLPASRPAIVYCVHTLLGQELSTYLDPSFSSLDPKTSRLFPAFRRALRRLLRRASGASLDAVGAGLDRQLARRAEGWIALTHESERVMRHSSEAPGALIPPPLPDPLADPTRLDPRATAESHGLVPGRYLLYSGNLDPYQELGLLLEAARRQPGRTPLVVATHDARAESLSRRLAEAGIRLIRVAVAGDDTGSGDGDHDPGVAEMQALIAGARATLCLRRTLGGFPIKLANSLALGTPPIAFHAREWGLEHGRNAWIASPQDPVASLAEAIERITRDDALAERLRPGARTLYESQHEPGRAAARTLALLDRVLERRRGRQTGSSHWPSRPEDGSSTRQPE